MILENKDIIGKLHCPECSCILVVIDNEIAFCPKCLLSSERNSSSLNAKESQNDVSSIKSLNFSKSSCC